MIPSARKLSAMPEMIWSTFRWIAQTAWIVASAMPASAATPSPTTQAACPPSCARDRPRDAEERAGQQHPLERDVDHAAALAEEAADRREGQRRRVAQRRGAERAPDDDLVEVRRRRARREDAEDDAEDACGDRASTDPPLAARPRPDAARDREDAERRSATTACAPRAAAAQARRRSPEQDPEDPDRLRMRPANPADACGERGHAVLRRRRRSHTATPPRFSPTKRIDEALDDRRQVAGEVGAEDRRVELPRRRCR